MRRLCLCLELIFLLAGGGSATAQDSTTLHFLLSTNPTQDILGDYGIKAEWLFKQQSVGLTMSYKPATKEGGNFPSDQFLLYTDLNMFNKLYNAFTVGISSKRFQNKRSNLFVEGELFYRYWWFENKKCDYILDNTYRFSGMGTERQEVYGIGLLGGKTFVFNPRSRIKMLLEIFGGISYRYKTYHFETFEGQVNGHYNSYQLEEGNSRNSKDKSSGIPFGFQCGIRLGLGL